jgi:vacuolar-type H+-ATPase subunit I/STV1
LKNFSIFFLVIGIFGNRADLVDEEKVDEAQVREYTKENKAIFARTSAKTGSGIEESIKKLVAEFLKVRENKISPFAPVRDEEQTINNVKIETTTTQNNERKKCCLSK